MAFTVSDFKANLASGGGGARPALYEVSINNSHDTTLSFGPTSTSTPANSGLLVKAASIPPANIAPLAVNYAGRAYKWSGFRTFDNWTVTVLNDEDFSIRNKMMKWMRQISGSLDGTRTQTLGDHILANGSYREGNATVTQLGTDGFPKQIYKFYNLWPTELAEIAVDWSSDMIQEYTIGFAYDYWGHGTLTSDTNVVNAA